MFRWGPCMLQTIKMTYYELCGFDRFLVELICEHTRVNYKLHYQTTLLQHKKVENRDM